MEDDSDPELVSVDVRFTGIAMTAIKTTVPRQACIAWTKDHPAPVIV
jgi:hypothetical protein